MNKKYLFLIIGLLLLLGLAFLFQYVNKPSTGLANVKADFNLGADELSSAFCEEQTEEAEKMFAGKVIEISGKVREYSPEGVLPATIILKENGYCPPIAITMAGNYDPNIAKLEIESDVKIKAKCTGLLLEVICTDGIIVKN